MLSDSNRLRQYQGNCLSSLNLSSLLSSGDNLRGTGDILPEDVSLDKPREPYSQLVVNVLASGNREDLCIPISMIR